jgi:hypothetical protein
MDYEDMPIGVLEIAGFDVTSLLWEQDEIEQAVSELALYGEFREHFKEALELINYTTSFWLEDGRYPDRAGSVIGTIYGLRDAIYEHACYAETTSLPGVIKRFHQVDRNATDSQLVATYALVLSVRAVEVLANWLFETELYVYDIDADLIAQMQMTAPKKFCALVEKERLKDRLGEIDARESFWKFIGEADKTILLADLYRQTESIDVSKKTLNVSSFLRDALQDAMSSKASQRASSAGKANSAPHSEKQLKSVELFARISQAAKRQISANPKISETDLVRGIAKQDGMGSVVTIRKYLRKGRFLPR